MIVKRNWLQFGTRGGGGICYMYMGYLWPFSIQCHFGLFSGLVSKWPVTRKNAGVETDWNLGLGKLWYYMGYLWPVIRHTFLKMACNTKTRHLHKSYFFGDFGIIRFTCLEMACTNSKTAGRRAKGGETWQLGIVVKCIWGIIGWMDDNIPCGVVMMGWMTAAHGSLLL